MQSDTSTLATLERVDIRTVWEHEALHFTPWLVENISLLSEAIGVDLEVQSSETSVGMFRADIIARDITTNGLVLIENQLEKTNHGHLGQLVTYSAGLQAGSVVWIVNQFTDDHRRALDWLNDLSGESVNFFGLELELWSVDGSKPAPKFNVVCKPNKWAKRVNEKSARVKQRVEIVVILPCLWQ